METRQEMQTRIDIEKQGGDKGTSDSEAKSAGYEQAKHVSLTYHKVYNARGKSGIRLGNTYRAWCAS